MLTEQKNEKEETVYIGTIHTETECFGSLNGRSVLCGAAETSPSGSGKYAQYSSSQPGGFLNSVGIPRPILKIYIQE